VLLDSYAIGAKSPSRAILEVKNGILNEDPTIVGGKNQAAGMKEGFNSFWLNNNDLKDMVDLGGKYYSTISSSLACKEEDVVGTFVVVVTRTPKGVFASLCHAKAVLYKYASGASTPSRVIFEAKDGKLLRDPHKVAGQDQGAGTINGFNRHWTGWNDINAMFTVANTYYGTHAYTGKCVEAKGHFIVVLHRTVQGVYKSLCHAKAVLDRTLPGYRSPSRAIFEMKKGVIQSDPHKIAGQDQGIGIRKGFNRYWSSAADITGMLNAANAYRIKYRPPSNCKDATGQFIVVLHTVGNGMYSSLCEAKSILYRYNLGYHHPHRIIFEVKNGAVVRDPATIAGQCQSCGVSAGFNKYWRNEADILRMFNAAVKYLASHLPIEGCQEATGTYIVVVHYTALGVWRSLCHAKAMLQRTRLNSASPQRMIFQVKSGKILHDATTISGQNQAGGVPFGFNKYWANRQYMNRMLKVAVDFYGEYSQRSIFDHKVTSSCKGEDVSGGFIVIVHVWPRGYYKSLCHAKAILDQEAIAGVTYRRAIFEVKNLKVLPDPHKIAGQDQSAGTKAGFNRQWNGWSDINAMHKYAVEYYRTQPYTGKCVEAKGKYVVVIYRTVQGVYTSLCHAKAVLDRYLPGFRQSRAIYEVKNGNLIADPRTISGQNQGIGSPGGFNSYITSTAEINGMFNVANAYLIKYRPPSTCKDATGKFIVVLHRTGHGMFSSLCQAKAILLRYNLGVASPHRAIFEVKDEIVSSNPDKIAGQCQSCGVSAGFNKYWRNYVDVTAMHKAANDYWQKHLPVGGCEEATGTFIVVVHTTVKGIYGSLCHAKSVLRRYALTPSGSQRCIFEVINGKVKRDPLKIAGQDQSRGIPAGFNRYWASGAWIEIMYKAANVYYSKYVVLSPL